MTSRSASSKLSPPPPPPLSVVKRIIYHFPVEFLEFGFVPRTWDIGPIEPVFMTFESSLQYGNWSASLGEEGGIIRLGKDKERYSISMFHQLRCLDIIGNDIIVANATDSKLGAAVPGQMTQHCMNYLRQMVLCRADLRLESARNPYGPRIAVSDVTHTCRDWNAVYRAAEKNR